MSSDTQFWMSKPTKQNHYNLLDQPAATFNELLINEVFILFDYQMNNIFSGQIPSPAL